ncbi:hypothetical protein NPIL_656891 [Nephila pilipes]|uniref:Uncharacterized protein n=1 Tax=Nephila pilipes TaxID=299642 RepID=A0A8X6MWN4_NEPPI|nr:hypothetical protein NPIL_656891 [Nephila pilipes]
MIDDARSGVERGVGLLSTPQRLLIRSNLHVLVSHGVPCACSDESIMNIQIPFAYAGRARRQVAQVNLRRPLGVLMEHGGREGLKAKFNIHWSIY